MRKNLKRRTRARDASSGTQSKSLRWIRCGRAKDLFLSAAVQIYIALTLASVVLIIATALSTTLFVEGSYAEDLHENLIKAATMSYALLIPAIFIVYGFGSSLLGILRLGVSKRSRSSNG